MSEGNKKAEQIEQEVRLSEQELDRVAGGTANQPIGNAGVGLGSKNNPSNQ